MENGIDDLWRTENPDSSKFTRYNRTSGKRSRIDRVFTDKKIASNTKINHVVVSVTDHYNAICNDGVPSKTEFGKDS